jgi:hypothetical protein
MYWAAIINFGSIIVLFFLMEEVRCRLLVSTNAYSYPGVDELRAQHK